MTQEQIKKYDELNTKLTTTKALTKFLRRNYPFLYFGVKQPIYFRGADNFETFYLDLSRQEVDNLLAEMDKRIIHLQKEIEDI